MRTHASLTRIVLLIALVSLAACKESTPADMYVADPNAVIRGKAIFTGTCGGYCHSTSPGLRDAPYLFDCVWKNGGSDQEIFSAIANGVPGTRMVSFKGALPEGDDDIWKIVAFLKAQRKVC